MMDTISTVLRTDVEQCEQNELTTSVGPVLKYGKIAVPALHMHFLQLSRNLKLHLIQISTALSCRWC